jgi:hypothetical protein
MTSANFKAFKPFMYITVPKEDTFFGSEFKFSLIVGTKIRPTRTLKILRDE